jgi:DNA-binding NarL/FixJ family response regulator
VKKRVLLYNFPILQSEGLQLLFHKKENYLVYVFLKQTEYTIAQIDYIEKSNVLLFPNFEITEAIRQSFLKFKTINPNLKLIALGKNYKLELLKSLAYCDVFLDASITFKTLLLAMDKVLAEDVFIDPTAVNTYINFLKLGKTTETLLTKREIDVLKLICIESTSKEIGSTLNISSRTVENHRKNLLTKTNSKGTAGLLIYAIKNDLFTIEN